MAEKTFQFLKPIEVEVLELMIELYDVHLVAEKLGVDVDTIKKHLNLAEQRTGCHCLVELVLEYDRFVWKYLRSRQD